MQVRPLAGEANRLYLTDSEYRLTLEEFIPALDAHYVRVHNHQRFKRATRLMGEAGFRADGIAESCLGEFYTPYDDRVEIKFMRHWGKDSTGQFDDGKRRDPWIPMDVKRELDAHVAGRGLQQGDKLFCFSYSQLRDRVIVVGEHLADLTGNKDWNDLRPHDFRAYFANRLAEAGVDDNVIMWLGGWTDEETYYNRYKKPFLAHEIQTALALGNLLDVDVEVPDEERPVEERVLDLLVEVRALLNEFQ